jgi:hypothetical protein
MKRADLLKKRDVKLVETFYQLYDVKRLRIDDVLKELSNKFFITENTVFRIIFRNKENQAYYDMIKSRS